MTVRSPVGALSRYLPYGFFFTCLLVRLFFFSHFNNTTACVATVMCFLQSIFPTLFAILAARLHRTIMDATGTIPRETLRDMDPHRPPPPLYITGSRICSMPELRLSIHGYVVVPPMRCCRLDYFNILDMATSELQLSSRPSVPRSSECQ
jgi:hypothetical protein